MERHRRRQGKPGDWFAIASGTVPRFNDGMNKAKSSTHHTGQSQKLEQMDYRLESPVCGAAGAPGYSGGRDARARAAATLHKRRDAKGSRRASGGERAKRAAGFRADAEAMNGQHMSNPKWTRRRMTSAS
jgi:hypothetical protein